MATRGPSIFKCLVFLMLETALVSAATTHIKKVSHRTTPVPPSSSSLPPPAEMPCAAEVARCWEAGGLWHGNLSECHKPLEQGPCADRQWFVLGAAGRPTGTCVPRPCILNQFPHQGRCVEEAEMSETCWSRAVFLDATGLPRCGKHPGWPALLAERGRCVAPAATTTDVYVTNTTDSNNVNSTYDPDAGNVTTSDRDANNVTTTSDRDANNFTTAYDPDYNDVNATHYPDGNATYYNYEDGDFATSHASGHDANSTYHYDVSGVNSTYVSDDPNVYNATNASVSPNGTSWQENFTNAVVYPGVRECAQGDDGNCVGYVVAGVGSVLLQGFSFPLLVINVLVFLKSAL